MSYYEGYTPLNSPSGAELAELAESNPDKIMYVRYKEPMCDTQAGELLTVYKSLAGIDCANINNFATVVQCNDINGYKLID